MDILDSYFQFIKICNIIQQKTINTKLYTIFANIYHYFHTLHEHEIELVFFTDQLIRTVNIN